MGCYIYGDENRELQSCVWESDTKEQFESKWMDVINRKKQKNCIELVHKGKVEDDEWLSSIYEMRSRWVPAYVKHLFLAGMSSSQKVESVLAFFKLYISKHNSLMDFILRFSRALAQQRHEELIADYVDINEQPMLRTPLMMEKQMAAIYTRKLFHQFQDELWGCLACVLQLAREDDSMCIYKVMERKNDKSLKVREVIVDKVADYASCSCKNFEFKGILCRHVLAYMKMKQIEYLPNEYILKRWTRATKSG